MSTEKINSTYEPPPPYTTNPPPQATNYPSTGQYGANVGADASGGLAGVFLVPPYAHAAGRNIFQGPVHPPPPGGVPVFPMAPGYYPSAQTVVVNAPAGTPGAGVQAVTVLNVAQCGPYPMQVTCPHCSAHVMSETTALPGLLTWLLAGGLILLGCWVGCCLIPCCVPECQDIEHRCPSCKQHLGTFRRINI